MMIIGLRVLISMMTVFSLLRSTSLTQILNVDKRWWPSDIEDEGMKKKPLDQYSAMNEKKRPRWSMNQWISQSINRRINQADAVTETPWECVREEDEEEESSDLTPSKARAADSSNWSWPTPSMRCKSRERRERKKKNKEKKTGKDNRWKGHKKEKTIRGGFAQERCHMLCLSPSSTGCQSLD